MSDSQWEIDLENDIKDEELSNVETKDKKNKLPLIYILLFLIFIAGYLFEFRTKGITSLFYSKPIVSDPSDIEELKNEILNLKRDIEKNNKMIAEYADRSSLLGVLFNENFTIYKFGCDKNELILLGKDWKASKSPKYVKLTEEDKKHLQKYFSN